MPSAIDRLLNKDVYRDTAEIMVKTKPVQSSEKRMAKAIANFIAKLPLVALEKHLSETELRSRFMYRFLAGLFDNPDDRIFLRWTEEWTLEANANALTRRRPDLSITKSCGTSSDIKTIHDQVILLPNATRGKSPYK
ncbi:hypothetical protein BCR43DRAFT_513667 [Syncephalastrum racemosum]|uniref:Uncharacterized protein n=1 Tax=Syncephalastrum racemosum TaxID=13706 RepID=A0A1X2HFJ9_SYNRA|nr:hypothetical protein BCR43DRAFT_513667 [Syncephalastrum racemosum]